jgi:hypothetical protein
LRKKIASLDAGLAQGGGMRPSTKAQNLRHHSMAQVSKK